MDEGSNEAAAGRGATCVITRPCVNDDAGYIIGKQAGPRAPALGRDARYCAGGVVERTLSLSGRVQSVWGRSRKQKSNNTKKKRLTSITGRPIFLRARGELLWNCMYIRGGRRVSDLDDGCPVSD